MKIIKGPLFIGLIWLLITSCKKEKDPLPVYGIITWTVSNTVFRADSFAVAEREEIGFNGRPTVTINGISSAKNTLHFILDSAGGTGVFIAGGSQITFNSIQIVYSGEDYFADNNHHSTSVTIIVTERTAKNIKGTLNGQLSSIAGNKIAVDGSFDMNF